MKSLKNLFQRITGTGKPQSESDFDESNLGQVLVDMGRMSTTQLREVITSQSAATDAVIAAEILRKGLATQNDISRAYTIQNLIRSGHQDRARLEITQLRIEEAKRAQEEFGRQARETLPLLAAALAASTSHS